MGAGPSTMPRGRKAARDMDLAGIRHDDPTQDFDEVDLPAHSPETPAYPPACSSNEDIVQRHVAP